MLLNLFTKEYLYFNISVEKHCDFIVVYSVYSSG